MRCFFNLVKENERLVDEEGTHVEDLTSLEEQAMLAVRETLEDLQLTDIDNWRLEITDAAGAVLMTFPLVRQVGRSSETVAPAASRETQ